MRAAVLVLLLAACGDDEMGAVDAAPADAAEQKCQRLLDGGMFISKDQHYIYEEEPTVAADGRGNITAAWIAITQFGSSTNGYAVSHDDGATWTMPIQIDSPDARLASDPVLAVDSAGNFFLSWVGYHTAGINTSGTSDMHVFVSRLDNSTSTFQTPVEASAGTSMSQMDKPWMTIDNLDRLIVTWEDGTSGNFIWAARSADQGATWQRTIVDSGGVFRNLAYPCLDHTVAHGTEVPVYVTLSINQHTVAIYRSDDGGLLWGAALPVATDGIFQDPSCAVRGSDVWVAYAQGTEPYVAQQAPTATGIRVLHSTDGAGSFAAGATITDGAARYMLSNLDVRPSGALDVLYYEGELEQAANLVHAVSTDAGATWMRSPIAPTGTLISSRGLACFEGDYIGVGVAGGTAYAAYTDNSTGRSHIKLVALP